MSWLMQGITPFTAIEAPFKKNLSTYWLSGVTKRSILIGLLSRISPNNSSMCNSREPSWHTENAVLGPCSQQVPGWCFIALGQLVKKFEWKQECAMGFRFLLLPCLFTWSALRRTHLTHIWSQFFSFLCLGLGEKCGSTVPLLYFVGGHRTLIYKQWVLKDMYIPPACAVTTYCWEGGVLRKPWGADLLMFMPWGHSLCLQ